MSASSSSSCYSESDVAHRSEHILEIDLNSPESDQINFPPRRATTLNFHDGNRPTQENLGVAASILQFGIGQGPSMRVITRSPESGESLPIERWLHLTTSSISFENFKRLALNVTLENHSRWTPVVTYLLNHIRDEYEQSSACGSYIRPGTVLRCDGIERPRARSPDISVTFISFPFFDVSKAKPAELPCEDSLHVTRSLFQQFYPHEVTTGQDNDQQFRKFRQAKQGQYLRVPQLWALVLNSTIIITCGPVPLESMTQGWLEIIDETRLLSTSSCLIHITDFHKRVTLLSPEKCGSFLELKQSIQKECLLETENIDQCLIHMGNNEAALEPSLWPKLLKDTQSAVLYLRISHKQLVRSVQNINRLCIEAPDGPKLIEYTDLSSDDGSMGGKALTLNTGKPHYKQVTKPIETLQAAVSIEAHLEDQGYIVNMKMFSKEDDFTSSQKPKIFRRPTTADADAETNHDSDTSSIKSGSDTEQSMKYCHEALTDEKKSSISSSTRRQAHSQYEEFEGSEIKLSSPSQSEYSEELVQIDETDNEGDPVADVLFSSFEESKADCSLVSSNTKAQGMSPLLTDTKRRVSGSFGNHVDLPDIKKAAEENKVPKALDEQDLRQVIREEIAVVLKHNEDAVEFQYRKRHEQDMRTKLAGFGLTEDQIQDGPNPQYSETIQSQPDIVARNAPGPVPRPTYLKTHRQYLDTRTLHHYNIPYEIDEDPNFIIVLREMNEGESDVLFEHTRRLRSSENDSVTVDSSESVSSANSSQARSHEPRSRKQRSRSPLRNSPSRTCRRGGWTSDEDDISQLDETTNPDYSAPYLNTRFDSDLHVEPFLAWPTTLNGQDSREDTGIDRSCAEREGNLQIKLTLLAIKGRIYKSHNDRWEGTQPSDLIIYKSGATIVRIPKQACLKKFFHEVDLDSITVSNPQMKRDFSSIHEELEFLRSRSDEKETEVISKLAVPIADPVSGTSPSSSSIDPGGRRIYWQIAKLCVERETLFTTLRELISQFVPENFNHALIQRCWGSLEIMSKILFETCRKSYQHWHDQADQQSSAIFTVKNIQDNEYLKLHQISDLSFPINQCPLCRKEKRYPDIDAALDHLQNVHTDSETDANLVSREHLKHWLIPDSIQECDRQNDRLLGFIETIRPYTKRLLGKAIYMRSSVANAEKQRGSKYLLPTALVKAAEKIFQFIYFSAYSLQVWQDSDFILPAPVNAPPLLANKKNITGAEYFAKVADVAMSDARDELMLMAHTGESRYPVMHIRATPESSVLFVLCFLQVRPLLQGLGIVALYREQLVRLRYEAGRKPSKRVLREVYLWKEELEVVASVMKQQKIALKSLEVVLNNDSFHVTNKVRIEAFHGLEIGCIGRHLSRYQSDKKDIRSLNSQADKLAESLRYNIDITEEGNSKAITIFTLVTIVFLPLSFVSSVFGMNTVDVRDMASSQSLFWAIALPVTAAVGCFSMLAAYGGLWFQKYLQYLKELRFKVSLTTLKRQRPDDEEEQTQLEPTEEESKSRIEGRRSKTNGFDITKRRFGSRKELEKEPGTVRSRNITFRDPMSLL